MGRREAIVAAGMVATVALAACGGSGGSPAQSAGGSPAQSAGATGGEFSFIAAEYSAATAGYWQDLVKQFEAKNPGVTVNLQVVSWNDITQKVDTLIAANQAPDLLNIDAYSSYAQDGLLAPMSDVLPAGMLGKFDPNLLTDGQQGGIQYAIPLLASVRGLVYNKDLFAKAAISTPPATWAELRDDALKIKATGNIGYGMPMGSEEAQAEFSLWMFGNGGDWKTDGKWTINSPQPVEALQYMTDLAQKDKVTQVNPGTTNRDDLWKVFAQGTVGIMMGASFFPAIMTAQNPALNYGLASVPVKDAQQQPTSLALQDNMMSFKTAKNPKLVGQFLDFFYQDDNYVKFLTQEGMLPTTTSAQQAMSSDPQLGPFIPQLGKAKFFPSSDPAWPSVQTAALQQLGTAVQGLSSPQSVLDSIQSVAATGH